MSTKAYYPLNEIGAGKVGFSKTRSIIEAAFYGNNVVKVNTLKEAYNLAKNSPGTIVTDMPVYRGEEFGLDSDARVLLFNDGAITGRYATARRIAGEPGVDCDALDKVVMDAVYTARFKKLYHATVYAGLDPEFMVKCHLLIPEGEENILYNWMLNFQYMSDDYVKMYKASKPVGDGKEADIYIFSDPQWIPNEAPGVSLDCLSDPAKKTLCYFNTETNCACILGMRYFGELAAKDCALFLWITFPCLCEALEVLTAWGFSYKTVAFVWVKQNRRNDDLFTGMGYWTRANAEICILATKGHPKRVDAGVRQVILSHIEEHSKKPDEARERIVRLMGDIPRVELFARQSPEGWDVWGNEVECTAHLPMEETPCCG